LAGKLALVTGANSGLGFQTTTQLVQRGCIVIMACRNMDKARKAKTEITYKSELATVDAENLLRPVRIDLSDLDDVRSFPERLKEEMPDLDGVNKRPFDIVVLNAGVMAISERQLSKQGIEMQMASNTIGHFCLLSCLWADRIKPAVHCRLVFVGSEMHKLANGINFDDFNRDKSYWKWFVYAETKLGMLLLMFKLNRLLEEKGINNVIAVAGHPGYADTKIHRHTIAKFFNPYFSQSAETSAKPFVMAATDPNAQRNGYCGPAGLFELYGEPEWNRALSKDVKDPQLQDRFWEKCEELTHAELSEKL